MGWTVSEKAKWKIKTRAHFDFPHFSFLHAQLGQSPPLLKSVKTLRRPPWQGRMRGKEIVDMKHPSFPCNFLLIRICHIHSPVPKKKEGRKIRPSFILFQDCAEGHALFLDDYGGGTKKQKESLFSSLVGPVFVKSLARYLSICGIGGWQEDVWSQCSIEHGSKRSKFSQRSSRFFFLVWAAPSAGNTLAHLSLILYMEVNSSIFGWDRWGEPRWGGSIKIGRGLRVDIHFHAPCWGGERRV